MLDVSPHLERFQIRLDRSGDANAILSNAKAAKRDIAAATRVAGSPEWTAEFAFPLDSASAAEDGLEVLNGSAPFLFGTCEHLGRLTIVNGPALPETWEREEVRQHTWQNLRVDDRLLAFKKGGTATKYRILRVSLNIASDVAVLVLLRLDGAALQFVNPTASLPRIFTRLPIRGATFLPINVIIDGQFNALRERDRIAMAEGDREKLSVALRLIPPMMQMAMEEDWRSCHWICRMAKVEKGFSDNESETEFWNEELKGVAQHLATLPIVKTEDGYLPAASDNGRYADFIVPRYSRASPCDEVELLPVWELAEQTKVLDPTVRELVRDWNEVTSGWESLGISLARRGLKEIGEEVSKAADELADLPVKVAPLTWIARFLDTLGQLPERYDCAILMDGLLPSQCGHLSAIASLSFDAEIPDDLKDLAETIGHAVRDRMLDATLATLGADDGYPFLQKVLHAHITNRLTEEMVLKECIDHVSSQLPDGENAEQGGELERGSVNLLRYIWKRQGADGTTAAQKCPLLTRAGSIAHHSAKKIMAPVAAWHEAARPFAEIYVPGRVLADVYCEESEDGHDLVGALIEWGIAFPDPLVRGQRKEIDEKLLAEMVIGAADVRGVKVRDVEFSRVALLETEVIQHCEDDPELASLLLGFVLQYLAPHDSGWRTRRQITAKRGGEAYLPQVAMGISAGFPRSSGHFAQPRAQAMPADSATVRRTP
ncbi:MAG: hypothetical protein B7Z73_00625, partial [Planctomycetia bacterium 21-64-5]